MFITVVLVVSSVTVQPCSVLRYVLKANELETQVIVIQLLPVRFVVRKIGLMRAELLFFSGNLQ